VASPKPGSGLGLNLHVPSKVAEETLYILQPDPDDASKLVKVPIDLGHYTAAGLLHECDLEGPEEAELFVQMAAQLGDGEAACFAIAAKRGWALATDDRRARRFAADANLTVITTPELVKLWAENTQAGDEEIAWVLQNIQRFAYFTPRPNSPEYAWWVDCLGKSQK
jgi:predicted nucleic acid-binding protein